jgi:alpha-L-rhamnosidase
LSSVLATTEIALVALGLRVLSRDDMRQALIAFVALLTLGPLATPATAQPRIPTVFDGAPAAPWISLPGASPDGFGVFHFRRVFDLTALPTRFLVHISADNRYRLFVNGVFVSSGPQRSDLMHWRYETVDLAPHLRVGRNVLASLVWNWGADRPVAQFSRRTGFLLQGNSPSEAVVNSGPEWKVLKDEGYSPIPVRGPDVGGYYAAPPGEALDAARYPWGWQDADFADAGWVSATAGEGLQVRRTQLRASNPFGEAGGWQLVPRSIPPMEESPVRFAKISRAQGIDPDDAFLRGSRDLVVPARTRAVLLLDQGHLTNAFAVLDASGGAGSVVSLTYAEALKDAGGKKGNRNEIEGKTIAGVRDEFRFDGGEHRGFQTLWFRTYRYVQMEIQTAETPLRIHDLRGIFVAYPLELAARFESDLPWLADLWEIDWRGARLCAWETYVDTPYYEQLQYIGDTRIQALITLYMGRDDRLVRQAIEHFDLSRIPEGITASRYPSDLGQYIPTFSLIWVAMVHDYWTLRDDPAYVRAFLPGMRSVLAWFEKHIDATGMLGPIPWWPYLDWAQGWSGGVPPGGRDGHSTAITLLYVYALDRAAELESSLGMPANAVADRALARSLREAVRRRTWNLERGLFRDSAESSSYSQQVNDLAVLTDTVPVADQRALMERVLSDTTLTRSTYYFSFYQLEALLKSGLGERYVEQLAPWRGMLELGLTTVPETPEPTRSDSHAWSAHPNYGLLATVLGVRPAEPGFKTVKISPHLGSLRRAEGRVPHPLGDIDVRLIRGEGGGLHAEITLPPGLSGVLEWGGKRATLRPGRQELKM